jgi:quercetin dioxygenase-like cupin family protein
MAAMGGGQQSFAQQLPLSNAGVSGGLSVGFGVVAPPGRWRPSRLDASINQRRKNKMAKASFFSSLGITAAGFLCLLQVTAAGQERRGIISHPPLLDVVLPETANQQVAVYEVEYAPGGMNPRHLHPAAITFHVLSGAGVWQEEGKPPVTLKAGESLFVAAGTIHAHWNPSATERLRFVEFIVSEKDKGRSIPKP